MKNLDDFIQAGRARFKDISPEAAAAFDALIVDHREVLDADRAALAFSDVERARARAEVEHHEINAETDSSDRKAYYEAQLQQRKMELEVGSAERQAKFKIGLEAFFSSPAVSELARVVTGKIIGGGTVPAPAPSAAPNLEPSEQQIEEWSTVVRTAFDKLGPKARAWLRASMLQMLVQQPNPSGVLDGARAALGDELFTRLSDLTALAWAPASAEPVPVVTPPPAEAWPPRAHIEAVLKKLSGPQRCGILYYLVGRGPTPSVKTENVLESLKLIEDGRGPGARKLTALGQAVVARIIADGPSARAVESYGPFDAGAGQA